MPNSDVYARVENGKVIEYPVSLPVIRNRMHNIIMYQKCIIEPLPPIAPYQYIKTTPEYINREVVIKHVVKDFVLGDLLNTFVDRVDGFGTVKIPKNIADLSQSDIDKVVTLAGNYVNGLLTSFVQTRGYDSITSAVSYIGSSNTTYNTEGLRVKVLRDSLWSDMTIYMTAIKAGTLPVPVSIGEIESRLIPLIW